MGSGGALLAAQQGAGRNHGQNQTFENTAITSANPGFYNGGSSQVTDQVFSKRGPSQASGTKQNEANSEAKCEISVRVQF